MVWIRRGTGTNGARNGKKNKQTKKKKKKKNNKEMTNKLTMSYFQDCMVEENEKNLE